MPVDFLEFGSREAIDVALHRLAKQGVIRRLARGLYDLPKEHPVLGTLSPSAEAVAQAVAGRDRTRLQPAGANAANMLGLTTQVPAKMVFMTDGPARTVKIGPMTIQFRRTTPKQMECSGAIDRPDHPGVSGAGPGAYHAPAARTPETHTPARKATGTS